MKSNVVVNVFFNNVDLEDVPIIRDAIEKIFVDYPDKRVTMTISERPTSVALRETR